MLMAMAKIYIWPKPYGGEGDNNNVKLPTQRGNLKGRERQTSKNYNDYVQY